MERQADREQVDLDVDDPAGHQLLDPVEAVGWHGIGRERLVQVREAAVVGRVPLEKRLLGKASTRTPYQVNVRAVRVELEQLPGSDTRVVELSHPRLAQPWLLLSKLRSNDERAAQFALAERIVRAYRQRWAIEDLFSWTKDALDWESVRVLDYEALRTLVSLAWLAAAVIFDLGAAPLQPKVLLLARLGGWTPGKAKPGKAALCTV